MLIHELIHLFLSLVVGIVFYWFYKDASLVCFSLLSGFFIDVDHFLDYFYWSRLKFNLKDFFTPELYVDGTKKVLVLLHGWEYLIASVILIFIISGELKIAISVLAVSYFLHLLFDQISSAGNIFSYAIIFRAINKFSSDAFNLKLK